MSGGVEDAHACEDLAHKVEHAAWDLLDAIKAAEAGHRGLTVDHVEIINRELAPIGYRLVKDKP